jgi:hypothetical protein
MAAPTTGPSTTATTGASPPTRPNGVGELWHTFTRGGVLLDRQEDDAVYGGGRRLL